MSGRVVLVLVAGLGGCAWIPLSEHEGKLGTEDTSVTDGDADTDTDADTDADTDTDADADADTDTDTDTDTDADPDRDGDGSPNEADCEPDDGAVYPGAAEVCRDGKVNDCDGSADTASEACGAPQTVDLSADPDLMIGDDGNGRRALEVAYGGDLTGDGVGDLLMSQPFADQVWVLSGSSVDPAGSPWAANVNDDFTMSASDSRRLGEALHGGVDVDGDGFDDLIVGSSRSSGDACRGRATVLFGPLSGTVDATFVGGASGSDAEVRCDWTDASTEYEKSRTGVALLGPTAAGGDALYVMAQYWRVSGSAYSSAFLFQGPTTGALDTSDAYATVSAQTDDYLTPVANLGDVNGDGADDLALAAYNRQHLSILTTRPATGTVGLRDAEDAALTSTMAYAYFGGDREGVRPGVFHGADLTGDGLADVMASGAAAHPNGVSWAGVAFVVRGADLSGTQDVEDVAYIAIEGETMNGAVGYGMTILDYDADGRMDLAVTQTGRPSNSGSVTQNPLICILSAPGSGTYTVPGDCTYTVTGPYAPMSIAGIPDMNADGADELLIGRDASADVMPGDEPAAWLLRGFAY